MNKNALGFIGALLLTGSVTVVMTVIHQSNRQAPPNHISILTVLQAHCGYNVQAQLRFTQNATLTYYAENPTGSQNYRERNLRLSVDGSFLRLDKTFLNTSQVLLSNGKKVVRISYQEGRKPDARLLVDEDVNRAQFQLATYGLLPILKRISDADATVSHIGATSNGNQFHVLTSRGSWAFYTNSNHLIDRVEVGGMIVTYGDYRGVDGLNLPFYQQVREGDRLLYEIRFDTVDFNPVFADDFFKSDLF